MTSDTYGPPADEAEDRALFDLVTAAFRPSAAADDPKAWERYRSRADSGPLRVIRRGGAVAGGLRAIPTAQHYGGRSVGTVALSAVAVASEHRGQGVATELMRRHLAEASAQGFALASLFPASDALYAGVGYERAGLYLHQELPVSALGGLARSSDLRPATDEDVPALRATYRAWALARDGHVDRDDRWWRHWVEGFFPTPLHTWVAHGPEGELKGYVSLTRNAGTESPYTVFVRELVALTRRAAETLASLVASHGTMSPKVTFRGGLDHPLVLLAREQEARVTQRLDWMVRVVDVARALEARGYPPMTAQLDLEVRDPLLPANDGRFRLVLEGGVPEIVRGASGATPDLRLDVGALASLYTGYATPDALVRMGRLVGPPEALRLARALFAGQPALNDAF